MHAYRVVWPIALVFCASCASGGGPSTSSGAAPPPSVVNPEPVSEPGNVTPPTTAAPPDQPTLANVGLQCELTKTDGACNQAKPKSMSITVDRVNTCNISAAGHELTLNVESSSEGARDSIRVRVPGYPNAAGRYTINAPNLVALYEADGTMATNGAAPHGAGSECSSDCTVDVRETPGGVRQVALDVSCKELCVPNGCLRCKPSGGGAVTFKLAVDCP